MSEDKAKHLVDHLPDEYDSFFEDDIPSNFNLHENMKEANADKRNKSLMALADEEIEVASNNPDAKKLENDFEIVRQSQRELVTTTADAIAEALALAQSSESPRAWEVVSALIKASSDINKDMLTLHDSRDKIKNKRGDKPKAIQQNQQNNYYLSPRDIIAQLREANEQVLLDEKEV